MARPNPFQMVRSLRPGRSTFNLSYEKKFSADMGILYPVLCESMVPGDKFRIGNQMVLRFQPLVAPILHEVNCFVHYFFVPLRLLWDDWESFITGGKDGDFATPMPRWDPTPGTGNAKGTIWDMMGFPINVVPAGALPSDWPRRAYNAVWNNYYRDENLQAEVALTNEALLNRNWEKDYFTSALPWQQRGTAPALPLSGVGNANFNESDFFVNDAAAATALSFLQSGVDSKAHNTGWTADAVTNAKGFLSHNQINFDEAVTFNVTDLRLAFQIQKWMERNARGGIRYVEFLASHFGVNPRDDRLQRPEFVGGTRSPVIFSEVLQTSSTDATSPQGNLAGHGISVNSEFAGSYFAQEYGVLIGLLSIMPRPVYDSQGIDRQWLYETRYDHYFPEFANLSEQPITRAELFADGDSGHNKTIFGFQGRYDEMRQRRSMVCGDFRDTFDYWHIARQLGSAPLLNSDFIKCVPRKDIFAVPSEPGCLISFGNLIRAIRPIPIQSNPGLIDHS